MVRSPRAASRGACTPAKPAAWSIVHAVAAAVAVHLQSFSSTHLLPDAYADSLLAAVFEAGQGPAEQVLQHV